MKLRFLIRDMIPFLKATEILDEQGLVRFTLKRDSGAIGLRMHLCDDTGSEIALIRQKLLALTFRFLLVMDGMELSVQPRTNRVDGFFYDMSVTDWRTFCDLYEGDYVVLSDEKTIAGVRKSPHRDGTCCEIELPEDGNTAMILAFIVTLEAAMTVYGSDGD